MSLLLRSESDLGLALLLNHALVLQLQIALKLGVLHFHFLANATDLDC